jgi:hypothetical protein
VDGEFRRTGFMTGFPDSCEGVIKIHLLLRMEGRSQYGHRAIPALKGPTLGFDSWRNWAPKKSQGYPRPIVRKGSGLTIEKFSVAFGWNQICDFCLSELHHKRDASHLARENLGPEPDGR